MLNKFNKQREIFTVKCLWYLENGWENPVEIDNSCAN